MGKQPAYQPGPPRTKPVRYGGFDASGYEVWYFCEKCGKENYDESEYVGSVCACCNVLCGECCKGRWQAICVGCVNKRMAEGKGREFVACKFPDDKLLEVVMSGEEKQVAGMREFIVEKVEAALAKAIVSGSFGHWTLDQIISDELDAFVRASVRGAIETKREELKAKVQKVLADGVVLDKIVAKLADAIDICGDICPSCES